MDNLTTSGFQPSITDFSSVNSVQYNQNCRYLYVYPAEIRDAIFADHHVSPCRNVEVIFLRGLPGQGKTHYCDTTIIPEHELRQRDVQIISANLVAAKAQAEAKGMQLTSENKNRLTEAYFRENEHRERKEVTAEIHRKAKEEMKRVLSEHSSSSLDRATDTKPLTLIIDNTNIRSHEAAPYLSVAMQYAVPKENLSIIEVSPFENKDFLQKFEEKLQIKGLLSARTVIPQRLSDLSFQGASVSRLYISPHRIKEVFCETLGEVRIQPLPEKYMHAHYDSYFTHNHSMEPNLLRLEATEIGADEKAQASH